MNRLDVYHYTECGLENVRLRNVEVYTDDDGDNVVVIKNVAGLQKLIAHMIVTGESSMSPDELRFLRTEMGFTQAELGKIVHKEGQSVGRWERGEAELDPNAEAVIRLLTIERLELDPSLTPQQVAERCVPRAKLTVHEIDAGDPDNYQPFDQAA